MIYDILLTDTLMKAPISVLKVSVQDSCLITITAVCRNTVTPVSASAFPMTVACNVHFVPLLSVDLSERFL